MEEDLSLTEAADLIRYLQSQVKMLEDRLNDWEKKYNDETLTLQVSAKLWDQVQARMKSLETENKELKEELSKWLPPTEE